MIKNTVKMIIGFLPVILILCSPFLLLSQSPFIHGVASGDPLSDRVIIWTRIQPVGSQQAVPVRYEVSRDSTFKQILSAGEIETSAERDFTVKVDINGLLPATTYYYRFRVRNTYSAIGRTRTTPEDPVDQLKFAVVSCNNYEHGYFTSFRYIANARDIDAVIHLGDYIYEYGTSKKRKLRPKDRIHHPAKELISLDDYRLRYAQYRTDPDLQAAHQQHPFITVWDDHESSNNSYLQGASGHNTKQDGPWNTRLMNAKRAYFEWMPIRDYPDKKIYRTIRYGKLADLIMIDTRLEGRDQQIYDYTSDSLFSQQRSMLGKTQYDWLLNTLDRSTAHWKLIGNQVIFSPLYAVHVSKRVENAALDIWDGYPAERYRITQHLYDQKIPNVIILTGDFHSSIAFDVPVDDWNFPLTQKAPVYNPENGQNAVAVEFATPSISSFNFNEFVRAYSPFGFLAGIGVKYVEGRLRKKSKKDKTYPGKRRPINPHLKYINLRDHGFFELTLTENKAAVQYYFIKNVRKRSYRFKKKAPAFEVMSGSCHVTRK